ncbi:MAG: fumarylacetoacetate hydrolase family protein [bacterium]
MTISRRTFLGGLFLGLSAIRGTRWGYAQSNVKRYVRFQKGRQAVYGLLEGETIHELSGSIFEKAEKTGKSFSLREVKLLAPCEPTKVLAVGGNYSSHLGDNPPYEKPELFFMVPSAVLEPEGKIVIPEGTQDCHYEGELVVVIGKKAKNISVEEAKDYVFGVTCGNDVSARDWQKNDMQWWRAKGSDTFAGLGPAIAVGVNYDDLLLTTRLNGEVKQQQRTSDFIFNVHAVVSFVSQFITLLPGDVIYTGTPGHTSAMKSGDVVEVEIEGIGILRNQVK